MDLVKEAASVGIQLRNLKFGNQYLTCPFCSHNRKGSNKKLKCLSVKIDADGLVYNCHHCKETGAFNQNVKRETRQGSRGQRPQRRDSSGYGALQRASLARWVNRT